MASEEDFQAKLSACHAMLNTYLEDLKEDRQVDEDKEFDSAQHQDKMEISNTFFRIIGFHHMIPSDAGKVYKSVYATMLRGLLQGAMSLCCSFMTEKPSSFMVPTAVLWETCKEIEQSAPANNKAAVLRKWVSMRELVTDAKSEVQEIAEEEGERKVAKQCAEVVGLVTMLFQKVERRLIPDSRSTTWLDRVYASAQKVADEVDVLVSQLYDVEEDSIMRCHLQKFVDYVNDLVPIVQEEAKDEHAKWFEMFVTKVNSIATKEE
ncbi:hypothetical protein EC973_005590 [Apophysomyces ossiformis]|uniref:Cyclin-D1-binding protein 1-like N-terminal domain-containing protein n=1 Tax=Apophysomyces ossiformis TaxID=679940 RepID=A0A8H7BRY3_9FUNG|nr:hypothetical protein EC973_005590 [Apophysomyces ossiformis]